jgi:CBS domain-containing protein
MVTIRQLMNRQFAAVFPDTTLGEAIECLTEKHINSVPVIDRSGRLIGIVSEATLVDVVFDLALKDSPVEKFMLTNVQAVNPEDTLARAAQLFALYGIDGLPVVEEDKLVGTFTRRDLMNYSLRTGQTLGNPLAELIPSLSLALSP